MTKHDLAEQIVSIQTLLDIAKDNLLENKLHESKAQLQQAVQEIKKINWRIVPVSH